MSFYKIERKAKEPIIPFDIFTKTSTIINLVSFLASAVLIGADVYLTIYMQNVLGFNAKVSGLASGSNVSFLAYSFSSFREMHRKVWRKSSNNNI